MAYPRPDFRRKHLNWTSLDGVWDILFDDSDAGLSQSWHQSGVPAEAGANKKRDIKVPYAFQTPASGIGLHEVHEVLWYERTIKDIRTPDEIVRGNRLLIRFNAVDYECSVWGDGLFMGHHEGGHVPFDLDISDAFVGGTKQEARLTLRVRDSATDLAQPRGKQYWGPVPESIFYTPCSGIWLSVWLESVPEMRLCCGSGGTVLRSDDIKNGQLRARVAVAGRPVSSQSSVEIETSLDGHPVNKVRSELPKDREYANMDVSMKVPNSKELQGKAPFNSTDVWYNDVALWHPDHPILYDLVLRLYDASGNVVDEVQTATGMRHLSWQNGDGTFRINGKPFFQTMVLDQGYWDGTGLTPPSPDALKIDIELTKKMGFHGCRKHQKVEDPLFYYWADRLGFLVWGEMANAYAFGPDFVDRVNSEWIAAVKRHINHPSVVTWTPANESWGYTDLKNNVQHRNHLRSLYYQTKTLDPTRPINDNCGWEHVITDLTTFHDYSDSAELTATCSNLENGILAPKGGHDMFVPPIRSSNGSTILDIGAQHLPGAPVICSEFGGVNIAPAKDTPAATDRDWGYTTASDPNDFLIRFEKLVRGIVKGGHSHGLVYTQLSDIEQEVNGLYSIHRKEKVPSEKVKGIMDAARDYYYKHVTQ